MLSCIVRRRYRLGVALGVGIVLAGAHAAGVAAEPAGHASAPDSRAAVLRAPDGVRRTTLDNGLTIIAVPNRLAPAVTTVMTYDVGARDTPAGFPGMAHAQEHMMFRGTKTLSASQISAISAAMGGDFNANTQDEATQYHFTVPAQYLDVALRLHAARLQSVTDSPADWEKERGAISQEVARDLSNPGYVAYKRLRERLFQGTPYAHDALGTKASFDKTTAKMLKAFHDAWYAPNNATLVIAGDIDTDNAIDTAKRLFGDIRARDLPDRSPVKLTPVEPEPIRMPTDTGYGLTYLAFRTPGTNTPKAYAAAEVLAEILGSSRGALYSRLVATGKSLGTQFEIQSMRDAGIAYAAAAFSKGADSDKLVEQMRAILAAIADEGVTAEQVTTAKRRMTTRAVAARDSIPGTAMRWSDAVAVDGMHSPGARIAAIRAVSAADVNHLAGRILDPKHSVLTVLTPKGSGAPAAGEGFGGKESFEPSHVADVALPDWAAKPLAHIDVPEQPIEPVTSTLDNGLRVIVVPVESSGAIHVYGAIRHDADLQTPPKQEGVSAVLSRLLDFGTQQHDRLAYQSALDAIGAQASAGTRFSLTVLPDYFQRGLDLLAENELQPALPQSAFKVVRAQVAGAVRGHLDSPDFLAGQALKRGLYPKNDPTLRHATPKSIKGLTHADVKQYYDAVFRPDLATIVVVGDTTPKKARAAVAASFGDWRAEGDTPDVTLPEVPANQSAFIHVPDGARVQDIVSLAQTVDVRIGTPAYRALVLGNQVLTGGFYASRLYRALRADRGLVYYIHSGLQAGRTRTHLSLEYGSQPDKVTEANRLIRRALVRMGKAPVSADELHRAKAGLIRRIATSAATVGAIGNGLLSRVDRGLPLDEPYRAARVYQRLDADAVQQAFKRWIRPDELVHIIRGPASEG